MSIARPSNQTEDDQPEAREGFLDLSFSQIVGGSLAAATAAALGSRLGLVGTIAGAAVISIVSAVAASLYTNSLRRTRQSMLTALRSVVRERRVPRLGRTLGGRRVLLGALTVFAMAAAAVTAVELGSGRSLAGTRDTTTFAQASQGTARAAQPAEGPVVERSVTVDLPERTTDASTAETPDEAPVEEPTPTSEPAPVEPTHAEPDPTPDPSAAPTPPVEEPAPTSP